jgi:hypothetical protein
VTKTKTVTLILASAALTAAVALPAWSALNYVNQGENVMPLASLFGSDQSDQAGRPIILAESDDHEDEGAAPTQQSGNDDEDSCEEDEGNCGSTTSAPAAAGTVPPPQNGLFGTAPAKVQIK